MFFERLKTNTFVMNVTKVFGIKSIVLILSMVSSIVSARLLEPEGKGVFTVATAIVGLTVQLGNLGIHSANTYYLSKDQSILPRVVGNSAAVVVMVSVISSGVFFLFNVFPNLSSIHGWTLMLTFAYIPIQLYNMYQQNYFIALDKIKKYSILEMMSGIAYPILLIATAFFQNWFISVNLALVLSILASVLVLGVGVFMLKGELKGKIQIDITLFRNMLPFGLKSYLSCLLSYLVLRADIFMIDFFLNNTENGLYSLAVNLADIVNMIAVSVSMLLFPKLSGMKEEGSKRKFINKTLKYMAIIMLLLVVCATIFSEFAIVLLYGKEYERSIPVFCILMPGIFFWALSSLLFNFFASENMIDINVRASWVGLLVNILANLLFINRLGISGVALASTTSYIVIFMILFHKLRKMNKGEFTK